MKIFKANKYMVYLQAHSSKEMKLMDMVHRQQIFNTFGTQKCENCW